MSQDIDDRLIETFAAVAEQTTTMDSWELVVADASNSPVGPACLGRGYPLLAAASVVLVLVGIGFVLWSGVRDEETTVAGGVGYVLAGEVVVGDDPLIVVSAPGPVPEFDTSDLGTEVSFDILDEVDEEVAMMIDRTATGPGLLPGASITKVTLVGRVQGEPWIITVLDGPNVEGMGGGDPNENFRQQHLDGASDGSGTGDLVPIDSLELIAPPAPNPRQIPGLRFTAPTGWVTWGPVSTSTAVVTFADSDQQLWMRPRAGVVVFPAQLDDGESFTLQALDANGQLVATRTETVSYGDDAAETNPAVGDNMGTIRGTGLDGQPLVIEPDGRPTALIFGASWCQPCQAGIDAVGQVLEDIATDIRIYSVPHYSDEAWPTDTDWSHPQLFPELDSPIKAVGSLPTVLILDGNNTVILTQIGFNRLADELSALDLDP